jgi:hypothetical protein
VSTVRQANFIGDYFLNRNRYSANIKREIVIFRAIFSVPFGLLQP